MSTRQKERRRLPLAGGRQWQGRGQRRAIEVTVDGEIGWWGSFRLRLSCKDKPRRSVKG